MIAERFSLRAGRLCVPFLSVLVAGANIMGSTARAFQESLAPDDVKHNTPARPIGDGQSVRIDVELALVNVTVTDPYNRLVTGLDPDNFRVFEDNVEQEVVTFSSEDVPISVGVILDLSGSMSNKTGKAKEAAIQFFKTSNPQDEFFLIGFNEHAELLSPFTDNIEDLQSCILTASSKGRTALLDAIYLGLSEMRRAHHAKRALLIIPTEVTTASRSDSEPSSGTRSSSERPRIPRFAWTERPSASRLLPQTR